jgi:hypothetical protein
MLKEIKASITKNIGFNETSTSFNMDTLLKDLTFLETKNKPVVNFDEEIKPLLANKSEDYSIDYVLKSVDILQSDKAKQVFEKGQKNN